MTKKYIPIDFEYRGTNESKLDLICCSFTADGELYEYWLQDEVTKKKCKEHLKCLRDLDYTFLVWNYIAEGQSFISLGLHPCKFKVIDLQIEYKMITNHHHQFMYGKHLLDGKEVKTSPPNYGAESTVSNARPKHSLSSGCYKLLDIKIDTDHKDEMRNICIYGTPKQLEENRKAIQDYCTSDIKYLEDIWEVIRKFYIGFFERKPDQIKWKAIHLRADTMARTALMTSTGYPIDLEKMKNLAKNVKPMLKELCEDINSQFEYDLFKWNNKEQRFGKDTKMMKKVIAESEYSNKWIKTAPSTRFPKGSYSLALDAFEKHFSYSHTYPENNPFAQYMRYLKTTRSLNGFIPKGSNAKNKDTIFNSVGSDGRVRGYLNPYGSQSSRYQPKATSFIPLKSAWLRSLIMPKKGRAIAGIDYKSEEFLLGGLVSDDQNMLDAYRSGDVYLYFAKLAGAVPKDGTKSEYKKERDLFKSTTLGISYLMGPEALGRKLTGDTGRLVTTEEAKKLIKQFSDAYPGYTKWQDDCYYTYQRRRYWMLPCGWTMFGDNENSRSVKNMPIQGIGGSILRKAIELAQDEGLCVIFPLHDALYIEYDSNDLTAVDILRECMRKAFAFYFEDKLHTKAYQLIQFDIDIWGPDYDNGISFTPSGYECKRQNIYIDPRSSDEYEKFKKYMGTL